MLPINNDAKVGKFWDYPIDSINDETIEEIKIIVSFREKALDKVQSGEWTEVDYKNFAGVIKKTTVNRFMEFIEIENMFLTLSKEEVLLELLNLLNKGILLPNPNNNTFGQMLASTIIEIQARL